MLGYLTVLEFRVWDSVEAAKSVTASGVLLGRVTIMIVMILASHV